MKRLLKDAQKLTGIKYDINNLSDVYEAIHVIQEELDITGTTAKEASTTFSGSFASMKASLQNLLGSMALGEDIRPKLKELFETTKTFLLDNFLPMVLNIFATVPDLIGESLAIGIGAVFGEDVANEVRKQLDVIKGIFSTFWDMIFGSQSEKDNIDFLANLGIDENTATMIVETIEGIKGAFDSLLEFVTNTWNEIAGVAMTVLPPLLEWLGMVWGPVFENIGTIFSGLTTAISGAWETIKSVVSGAVQFIVSLVTLDFEGMGNALSGIWDGIKSGVSTVWEGIKTYFSGVVSAIVGIVSNIFGGMLEWLNNTWENMKSAAFGAWDGLKNGVIGIIDGLVSGAQRAWDNLTGGVKNAVDEAGKFFDRLWNIDLFGAGKAIIDGFLGGLKAAWDGVTGFISGIANWIAEHKGPIEYDRKLLIPAGNAIMYGLNEGLKDNFETVKGTVSGMAREISNQFSTDALNVGVADVAAELSVNTQTYTDLASTNNSESVVAQLTVVENVLQQILDKDVNTYLDGEVLAKNSYDRQYSFMQREGI